MKVTVVPSSWLRRNGRRLDCGPYLSGALEATLRLQQLPVDKVRLADLCQNGASGIFHIGRKARNWVACRDYGVPFLGSSDVLKADLSGLPLMAKSQVARDPRFVIRHGWILLSRSGTIGRTVYVRRDMDGMACSEHVMRVVPDPARIPPGYVYAYLSSRFGLPLVVSHTYGAIIQHIEPHHIADLPVPRLGHAVEHQAHALVDRAARLRVTAALRRQHAVTAITRVLGWNPRPLTRIWTSTRASQLQRRLDGFYHAQPVDAARSVLANHPSAVRLGDVVDEVFAPNRGARHKVTDPDHGLPFLSSSAVFRLDPVAEYLVSRHKTPQLERLLVTPSDLLLPRSGQLGGIIGRAVLPLPTYYGHAASEHLVRVRCRTRRDAHALWAVLACQAGYYATLGTAFGSSIPSLDCELLANLYLPWLDGRQGDDITRAVVYHVAALSAAVKAERRAVAIVEHAIAAAA